MSQKPIISSAPSQSKNVLFRKFVYKNVIWNEKIDRIPGDLFFIHDDCIVWLKPLSVVIIDFD